MKLLILLLSFFCGAIQAQCRPMHVNGQSSAVQTLHGSTGEAYGQWCRTATNLATGVQLWEAQTYACLKKYCNASAALQVLVRAANSRTPGPALQTEAKAAVVRPATREEFVAYYRLHYFMCVKMYQKPPIGVNVTYPPLEQSCGQEPK